jgi:hypothetical protein
MYVDKGSERHREIWTANRALHTWMQIDWNPDIYQHVETREVVQIVLKERSDAE